jgi:hypothetical protein
MPRPTTIQPATVRVEQFTYAAIIGSRGHAHMLPIPSERKI